MSDGRPLTGKVALITGGSRGVGLATARRLAQTGAAVALVARNRETLDTAVGEVQAAGGRALAIAADVTDEAAIQQAVSRVEAGLGGLDILVNNAGIGRYGPIAEQPADEWRRVVEVNLIGVYLTTRAALPAIRRRGGGQIVSISTGAARQGYPNMSAYCASKWGLQGFMAALTAEVADEPIRCSTVVPGSILTDFGIRTRADRLASGQKFLEPEDVAEAILTVLLQPPHAWMQEVTLWPR